MDIEENIIVTEKVFERLYNLYWKELYLYCNSYLKDVELSKELVQDIFINLWENRNKTVIRTSPSKYLFSAAKLKIFEYYRRQSVRNRYLEYKTFDVVENANDTEQQVYYNELKDAFGKAIEGLPARSQLVYQMSRDEGMNNKSIASTLSITEKAVEGNITRAISHIRKRLKCFK